MNALVNYLNKDKWEPLKKTNEITFDEFGAVEVFLIGFTSFSNTNF